VIVVEEHLLAPPGIGSRTRVNRGGASGGFGSVAVS
jgi:hypothetical protein